MTRAKPFLGRLKDKVGEKVSEALGSKLNDNLGETLSALGGKVGGRAFISLTAMKQEVEALSVERMERLARRIGLVRRAEFEDLQAMVKEMRRTQDALLQKIESLMGTSQKSPRRKAAQTKAGGKSLRKSGDKSPAASAPRRKG